MLADLFDLILYLIAMLAFIAGAAILGYVVYSLRTPNFNRSVRVAFLIAGIGCWFFSLFLIL